MGLKVSKRIATSSDSPNHPKLKIKIQHTLKTSYRIIKQYEKAEIQWMKYDDGENFIDSYTKGCE